MEIEWEYDNLSDGTIEVYPEDVAGMSEDEVSSYVFSLCARSARINVDCYVPGLQGIVRELMEEASKEGE